MKTKVRDDDRQLSLPAWRPAEPARRRPDGVGERLRGPRRNGQSGGQGESGWDSPTEDPDGDAYRLIHTAEVLRILGISRTGLYMWRKAGIFLAARRIGPNSIRWLMSDIREFLDSRPKA